MTSGTDDLRGRTAVVTGGASGIGRAIAARLVAGGASVLIADIEQAAIDHACAELGVAGLRCDVSSADSMAALAAEAARRFERLDLFFSNAGVASTGRIADMRPSDWQWLLGVNLWGLVHGIGAFLPLLRANPRPSRLALTASIAGLHTTPGMGGYTVSKFAAVALAETLAEELAEDGAQVGVTILCPGPVSTRLGDSQRNRADDAGALVDSDLERTEAGRALRWADPAAVADTLLRAIARGDLHAFTHPEMAPLVLARHQRIAHALAGGTDAAG